MKPEVVLGVDSSTQSTKVLALDLDNGSVLAQGRAPHSGESIQNPLDWWNALRAALAQIDLRRFHVRGISVAGQQHGLVTLDARDEIVRPAPLWNNVDSASDADRLNQLADFAGEIGTRLVASITITKLAHLARTDPGDLARTASVCLPHDWLNLRLTGRFCTDRGEATGSGWWSARDSTDRRDLLSLAVGPEPAERLRLPEVRAPDEPAGRLRAEAAAELGLPVGLPVGPGAGDNMASALGVGAAPAEIVISLGTSGTAFAVSDHQTFDRSGGICGFADAAGRYLPLACMLNCTRVLETMAKVVGLPLVEALDLAGTVEPGAGGLMLIPYLQGERTPNLPLASGSLYGIKNGTMRPDLLVRAAMDGVAAGLAYCVEALERLDVPTNVVTLVGGGAAHPAWQQAIADATGMRVVARAGGEHCARGAATQIAAIVRGMPIASLAEAWRPDIVAEVTPRMNLRERFALDQRREWIEEHLNA